MTNIDPITKLTNNSSMFQSGGHILYMYNETNQYVRNAVSFIHEGIKREEVVFVIETDEMITNIKKYLSAKNLHDRQLNSIIYINDHEFYFKGELFNYNGAGGKLTNLVQPYINSGYHIRTWGRVPVPSKDPIERLVSHECNCDQFVSEKRVISVCCYNGLTTPAYVQNELLKSHTHLITDDEYTKSPFYRKNYHKTITMEDADRLHRLEERNNYLQTKTNHLILENHLIKLKSELIKESESKLRTIINELPIPIIIRNKNKILFSNKLTEVQFNFNNQVNETSFKPFFKSYDSAFVDSSTTNTQKHKFIHSNGEEKYYIVKSIDISFENTAAILHAFVDITKEKQNENLLIRSEKMNIAGELAASIAHELRNPLTSIKGFFQMLKNSGEEKSMYYSIIGDELSRIEQISSELLSLAKPHSENRKTYNLIQIIDEVKLLLISEANMKNVELILECNDNDVFVNCDDTKIKQVFINLLKNAIDAMESGGIINIRVTNLRETVKVQVIDQGSGIPEELIKKIGEPFYTTKEKGTGIGLMVCYQIIENYGGTIEVDSNVGVGTTFTITLPISAEVLAG
ncbi:MEDS domain-containing protein [Bacillus luteolus]|uniref:histidine kinase n=1 Tax=Litchfieldia luteola TaxID=682179 RepID=A0ABR9QD78_9BACI|nr:ATP-binding protein [Cytobacillus luteolus]MBE4906441.1 MEDS domain-containing protein [Cytobacillus luteolus]MBP1941228.1 two-component system sporulation sensor kinase A [Cytobacillus luteolus]